MEELIKIISVVFISSFKFVAGPPLAFAYDFTYVEAIASTVIGGMLGVFLISYYTPKMVFLWNWMGQVWYDIMNPGKKQETFSTPAVDFEGNIDVHYVYVPSKKENFKKIFTRRNRRIVKIWTRWGLFGIALITPVTISIPIGTFIATRLVPNRKKVFLYMFLSLLFWSVLLSSLFEIYQVVSLSQLESLFFE